MKKDVEVPYGFIRWEIDLIIQMVSMNKIKLNSLDLQGGILKIFLLTVTLDFYQLMKFQKIRINKLQDKNQYLKHTH